MISEVLKTITDNFDKGYHQRTLMSFSANFDELGRPLNCDPNYMVGSKRIEGKEYFFVRKGWIVRIWDKPVSYMAFVNNNQDFIEEVDLTPDYILERQTNHLNGSC